MSRQSRPTKGEFIGTSRDVAGVIFVENPGFRTAGTVQGNIDGAVIHRIRETVGRTLSGPIVRW